MNTTLAATLNGARVAALAAALAASSLALGAEPPPGSTGKAIAADDAVHCYGQNACKGQSDCKTALSSCKAQNSCKGHGFKAMKASDCLSSGGVIGDVG